MNKIHTGLMVLGIVFVALLLLRFYARGHSYEGFQEGVDEFVLYYADWCPHCKTVKPIFKDWGADKGSVQIGGKTVFVRMVEEQEMSKEAQKPDVKGYPTFILRKADGTMKEFGGDRSPEGWNSWLNSNL